jgi:putative FmdB family regulatory protein
MPLYEYQCDACGHRVEVIQKFSDPPLEQCPKCGGAVHKLQSAPAFQFKGSGWYITDYAKKDGAKSDGDSKSADKTDKTSDKPAAADKDSKKDATSSAAASPASSTPKASPTDPGA